MKNELTLLPLAFVAYLAGCSANQTAVQTDQATQYQPLTVNIHQRLDEKIEETRKERAEAFNTIDTDAYITAHIRNTVYTTLQLDIEEKFGPEKDVDFASWGMGLLGNMIGNKDDVTSQLTQTQNGGMIIFRSSLDPEVRCAGYEAFKQEAEIIHNTKFRNLEQRSKTMRAVSKRHGYCSEQR